MKRKIDIKKEQKIDDKQIIEQSGLFDVDYYHNRYPDVKDSGCCPIDHYLNYGAIEGRDPSVDFDTKFYISQNPDIGITKVNPLVHYIVYGQSEGLCTNALSSVPGYAGKDKFENSKIFCISFQRNGTTSTGHFFSNHGYSVAGDSSCQRNDWGVKWYNGQFEDIFASKDFCNSQVFEDGPWFSPDFYKYLFHRFKKSKFILIKRDPEKWFRSMISHSNGRSLGRDLVHAKIYGRGLELLSKKPNVNIDWINGLDLLEAKEKYIDTYNLHNIEVQRFFSENDKNRLICLNLEDDSKWIKLGRFFGIEVAEDFSVHENKSVKL
ncbi:sulfotransferase [Francisella sp. XLW-1]|uniref:sulfotransferase n=1 Tax=Francisella sp. XLW-1 TaxID=2610887 RepID=UPI00168D6463|nr:sulfotransferase [Francisella sp. XLW-1]